VLRIFGPKKNEVTGGCRKLHDEDFHNLYSSPDIIMMTKSRKIRWAVHVARMGRCETHAKFWSENMKGIDHSEDSDTNGRIILKLIVREIGCELDSFGSR
jgi:hypothetical protein